MKIRFALLTAALVASQALAATDSLANEPALSKERLSGAFSLGYNSIYTGRGLVISDTVAQGNGSEFMALQLNYDVGRKSRWSFGSTIAYTMVSSGHTLYGNPKFGPNVWAGIMSEQTGQQMTAEQAAPYNRPIKQCNLENEFAVVTSAKYSGSNWAVTFGHDFIHGGMLGVMAKHYRDQGASCVNEFFIKPEWAPAEWVDIGVKTSLSTQGIHGWWFEPYVTFKAPIIGSPENVVLAARCTFAMSATADYYDSQYFACSNGSQAFWIKLDFPWFVDEERSFIITPSVSFNWCGKGGIKANEVSEFRQLTEDKNNVPFRNFGVVAGISATYTF